MSFDTGLCCVRLNCQLLANGGANGVAGLKRRAVSRSVCRGVLSSMSSIAGECHLWHLSGLGVYDGHVPVRGDTALSRLHVGVGQCRCLEGVSRVYLVLVDVVLRVVTGPAPTHRIPRRAPKVCNPHQNIIYIS